MRREDDVGGRARVPLGHNRPHHLALVICSNNVSILHRFRDITTVTVYVTACDLQKCFRFNKVI